MRSHEEMPTSGMKWKKLSLFRRSYELRAGESRYGSLEWGNAFGTQARGEILGSVWRFRRSGIFKPIVTVQSFETGTTGILRCHWNGEGTLELEGGRRYHWRRLSFWGCRWAFLDDAGVSRVRFRPEGLLRCCGLVDVPEEGGRGSDIPLLVLLGWYLKVLAEGDAAVVAA